MLIKKTKKLQNLIKNWALIYKLGSDNIGHSLNNIVINKIKK